MIRLLPKYGCDPDAEGYGMALLMAAARLGNEIIVQELLAAGVDVNQRLGSKETALTFAREKNHPEIIRLLKAAGPR